MMLQRNYKVILLSAGFGTRLAPISELLPKCLMPVRGVPIIAYWLQKCIDAGVIDIAINTHYQSEKVKRFLSKIGHRFNLFVSHENTLLGTAGTLRTLRRWIGSDPVVVVHADNYSDVRIEQLISHHEMLCDAHRRITMAVFNTDQPKNCGVVELRGDTVVRFHEKVDKPPGNIANAAVYVFEPEIMDLIADSNLTDISTEVLPKFLSDLRVFQIDGFHIDIGTIENLRKSQNAPAMHVSDLFINAIGDLEASFKQVISKL